MAQAKKSIKAKRAANAQNLYRFKIKKITEKQITEIVTQKEVMAEVLREKQAMQLITHGKSYEGVAQELGISTSDAFKLTREIVRKWSGELSMTANEVREIEVKRLDAMCDILTQQAFPHKIIDMNTGQPQLYPDGTPVLTTPDHDAMKLLLNVQDRRAKLLGLDAADKLREKTVDIMTRKYIGGDPDDL